MLELAAARTARPLPEVLVGQAVVPKNVDHDREITFL